MALGKSIFAFCYLSQLPTSLSDSISQQIPLGNARLGSIYFFKKNILREDSSKPFLHHCLENNLGATMKSAEIMLDPKAAFPFNGNSALFFFLLTVGLYKGFKSLYVCGNIEIGK